MSTKVTPIKKPSPCNHLNMRRASLALTKLYDDRLAPSGVTVSQFSLLKHIRALGTVSVSALALAIRLDRTTLVRNLKPLEEGGLVSDDARPGARSRELSLTEKGQETYNAAEKLWQEAQQTVEDALGSENLALLTVLLSKIESLT